MKLIHGVETRSVRVGSTDRPDGGCSSFLLDEDAWMAFPRLRRPGGRVDQQDPEHVQSPFPSVNQRRSRGRSHLVVLVAPRSPPVTRSSRRRPTRRILAQDKLVPDFPEGRAELLDAEGVDDGVDGRVPVREDDGDVDEGLGLVAAGAEEGDAVEDVERQPADGEQEQNQRQRLGELQFLAEVTAQVRVARRHLQTQRRRFLRVRRSKPPQEEEPPF